jgi:hypothetical protein
LVLLDEKINAFLAAMNTGASETEGTLETLMLAVDN